MPKGVFKRKPFTLEEHRKNLSLVRLKNPNRYWLGKKRLDVTNENQWKWKGDKVSYSALHAWIRRKLGRPTICCHCGKTETRKYYMHWANISGEYKRELSDWIRLCALCHKKFDKASKDKVKRYKLKLK